MTKQEITARLKNANFSDSALIATIFHFRGIENPRNSTGFYLDYSSCEGCGWYKDVVSDPALCEMAIENFKKSYLRNELDEEESRSAYMHDWIYPNGISHILEYLGILDEAIHCWLERVEKAAYLLIHQWITPGSDPLNFLSFNAVDPLFFSSTITEKRWDHDVYGLAIEVLNGDSELKAYAAETFAGLFSELYLRTELTQKEIEQNSKAERPSPGVFLEVSDNSIKVDGYNRLLHHLGIMDAALKAYYGRYEKALRLNPHNTEELIKNKIWELSKPEGYKAADRLLPIFRSYKGSIKQGIVEDIISIEQETTLKEKKGRGLTGSDGLHLLRMQVKMKDGTSREIYQVLVWYAGGDEADEWWHGFEALKDAEYCYGRYEHPEREVKSSYKTELAQITVPGKPKKKILGGSYQDYFVDVRYEGDLLVPFWNSRKLDQLGLTEEVKALGKETDIREILGTRYEPALLKWGVNEFDVVIESDQAIKDKELLEKKEVIFERHNCWETGFDYHQLVGRYPPDVFEAMKPELQYHNEEIEEEGNWKGWFTFDKEAVNKRLNKIGWTCR